MATQVLHTQEATSFSKPAQELRPPTPPMKTYNVYYTTSRLNVRLHPESSSNPCSYYGQSQLLTAHPSILLKAGDSKSSPLVATTKLAYLDRNILIATSDPAQASKSTKRENLSWEVMRRNRNRMVRGDYAFEAFVGGRKAAFSWEVRKESFGHYFKTLYQCYDEEGRLVASMKSGGMTNLKKGAEIDVMEGLEGGVQELFLVSALGIWCAEAGWSVFQGYQSKEEKEKAK